MRQLKNVTVKGVALVKRPANRKPIHLYKTQGGDVPTTTTADAGDSASEAGILKAAAPESVLDAIRNISLSKGEDADARDTLMGIAHLLHNSPHVSMDDLMAAGAAAGLSETVAKAKSKPKAEGEDESDEDEEDDYEVDDEDEEEDEDDGKVGDATDKLPPALRAKAREKQKKSAGESQAKGEAMPAELEKAEQVTITKAEHQVMMQRLEKAEREWARHEAQSILKSIKEENQASLTSLACDHDKLAVIVKAVKDRSPEQAKELLAILKGFDAQVAAAGSSGSIFKSRAVPNGAAPSGGFSRFQELVKAEREKSGCTESEATLRVAKTAEGNSAYIEHNGAN